MQSVHQRKASTLGNDVFLLDIVPPSPCHTADVVHARSQSCDPHNSVSDRDTVIRPPPPQPGFLRDRAAATTLGDSAGPTVPARWPMTPQSPPPPPPPSSTSNSLSGDVYYNGVTNAAFIHPDPARVESTMAANSRRVAGVCRPSSGHRVPQSLSVFTAPTSNGIGRSPVVPRCRDVDVNDGRRSAAGTVGNRPREAESIHSHPPPPPPPPASSVPPADVTRHQDRATSVSHPAGLRGPLSLSTGVLCNFSPPAPHLTRGEVRLLTGSHSRSHLEILGTLCRVLRIPGRFLGLDSWGRGVSSSGRGV